MQIVKYDTAPGELRSEETTHERQTCRANREIRAEAETRHTHVTNKECEV